MKHHTEQFGCRFSPAAVGLNEELSSCTELLMNSLITSWITCWLQLRRPRPHPRPRRTFAAAQNYLESLVIKELIMCFTVKGGQRGLSGGSQLGSDLISHNTLVRWNHTNLHWNLYYCRQPVKLMIVTKQPRGLICWHVNYSLNSNNIHLFACLPWGVSCSVTFLLHSLKG